MKGQASEGISQCRLWGQAGPHFSLLGRGIGFQRGLEKHCCGALVWFLRFSSSEREFFPQLNVLLAGAPTFHSALLCRKSLPSMFCDVCLSVAFRRFLQGK